jgi:hypothetical protein
LAFFLACVPWTGLVCCDSIALACLLLLFLVFLISWQACFDMTSSISLDSIEFIASLVVTVFILVAKFS